MVDIMVPPLGRPKLRSLLRYVLSPADVPFPEPSLNLP